MLDAVFIKKFNPGGASTVSTGVSNGVTVCTGPGAVATGCQNSIDPGVGNSFAKRPFVTSQTGESMLTFGLSLGFFTDGVTHDATWILFNWQLRIVLFCPISL
jgi:hypothetical protein